MAGTFQRSYRAQRAHRFTLTVVIFTVLVALLVVLTSYALAVDPIPPARVGVLATRGTEERPVGRDTPVADRSSPSASASPALASTTLGVEDGVIPDGETLSPFDMEHPTLANLDPDLRRAIRSAATDAEADGVDMVITSGWRSIRYQQALLDEAVVTYGSEEEARHWVNTPDGSTHVTGDAVDVGYTDADYWLMQFGNEYGLCQTYANEIWHFELAVEPGDTCPAPLTDASSAWSEADLKLAPPRRGWCDLSHGRRRPHHRMVR